MAENEKVERKKGGFIGFLIGFIVVVLLLVGGFAALLRFDVAGLGTQIIGPKLVNIPIVKMVLPPMPEEELEEDGETYSFETVEEAIEALKTIDKLLKEKEETVEKQSEDLLAKEEEIVRLKEFENNQLDFEKDKAELDQLIADNAGADAFKAYVEKTYQENALNIYESIISKESMNEDVKVVVNIYENMEASNAAPILEKTAKTDIDMVVDVVAQLSSEKAGEILSLMDTKTADRIIRYIYPEEMNSPAQ